MNLTFKTLEHLKSGYRKLRKRQHLNAVKKLAGTKLAEYQKICLRSMFTILDVCMMK